MRLHKPTKIIFIILAVLILAGSVLVLRYYYLLRQTAAQSAVHVPNGTCSPDLTACKNNPQLCMADNLNKVCN